jgi:nucleotide-binding universal stress UspA family protein
MASPTFTSILVGTDGSSTAHTAVIRAIQLAGTLSAKLVIVSAYAPSQEPVVEVLEAASEEAKSAGVGEVASFGREGDPADVLLDVAEEQGCDLIVVGNQGMQGARRFLLGSVPNKVSHHSPASVLIIRTGEDVPEAAVNSPISSILVGTDGSATAKKAVTEAMALAGELEAKLIIVSAFESPTTAAPDATILPRDVADRVLAAAVHEASAAGLDDVETYARDGDAASAILDVAEDQNVDLIIVGNQGMAGSRRRVVGSIPNKVSHHAPSSVLIVQTS